MNGMRVLGPLNWQFPFAINCCHGLTNWKTILSIKIFAQSLRLVQQLNDAKWSHVTLFLVLAGNG